MRLWILQARKDLVGKKINNKPTPLQSAAEHKSVEVTKVLLNARAQLLKEGKEVPE